MISVACCCSDLAFREPSTIYLAIALALLFANLVLSALSADSAIDSAASGSGIDQSITSGHCIDGINRQPSGA